MTMFKKNILNLDYRIIVYKYLMSIKCLVSHLDKIRRYKRFYLNMNNVAIKNRKRILLCFKIGTHIIMFQNKENEWNFFLFMCFVISSV